MSGFDGLLLFLHGRCLELAEGSLGEDVMTDTGSGPYIDKKLLFVNVKARPRKDC